MKRPTVALALALILALAGCGAGTSPGKPASPAGAPSSARVTGTVTVLAAASLTGTFDRIGKGFEARYPGTRVSLSYGGSSTLAQQITAGAPADVFAAASPATMKTVTDAGLGRGTPAVFTRNQLVIAVAKGNPKHLTTLPSLTQRGIKVALCADQVPCGAAAKKALSAAGAALTPVTLEQDVKAALSKVRLGEVDAALVYRTDTEAAASGVDGVEFPESAEAINDYPIDALARAANPAGAAAFVAYVESPDGQKVLTDAGFQHP